MESDVANNRAGCSLKFKAVLRRIEMVEQGLVTLILTLIILLAVLVERALQQCVRAARNSA